MKGATVGVVAYVLTFTIRETATLKGSASLALFFALLVGFGIAGYVASTAVAERHALHGGIAALVAAAVSQLVGLPIRLAREPGYSLAAFAVGAPLACLLAMSCGIGGAYLATARANRSTTPGENPS